MAESVWTEDDQSFSGLACNHTPQCIFCEANPDVENADMEVYDIKLLNFSLEKGGRGDRNSYATDVVMYCPRCGWHKVFGVAISKEHGERSRERAKGLIKEYRSERKKETK